MIIDRIDLENFGTYAGTQSIETRTNHDRPIVLLIGLNGAGKTTFLDAVLLALYGRRARCSNRGKLGYEEFLRRSIHRYGDEQSHAAVTLHIRRHDAGKEQRITLRRSWTDRAGDFLDVTIDGERDALVAKHWDEFVDRLLPVGIANLFFFDGEKIEQLAEVESAQAIMRTAFSGLLGLEVVDRLEGDLRVFERRKAATVADDDQTAELRALTERIEALTSTRDRVFTDRASLQNELDWWQGKELHAKEQFERHGGQHYLERTTLRAQKEDRDETIIRTEGTLRSLAANALPLALITPLIDAATATLEAEQTSATAARFHALLVARDEAVIAQLRAHRIARATLERIEELLESDRTGRTAPAVTPAIGLDDIALRELHDLVPVLRAEVEETQSLLAQLAHAEAERDLLQRSLDSVPDDALVLPLITELNECEKTLQDIRKRIAACDDELRRADRELTLLETRRDAVAGRIAERRLAELDDVRAIRHAARVRNTLNGFREAVIEKHVARVSQLVVESFRALARKETLIDSVRIHPKSLAIELFDGQRNSITPERLSAGERQLLATALLWGLARASGRPLPVIIDTPLGRLDSNHRHRLLTNYLPSASHQVIVLATDEEIGGQEMQLLASATSRVYHLRYDELTLRTLVERVPNLELAHVS